MPWLLWCLSRRICTSCDLLTSHYFQWTRSWVRLWMETGIANTGGSAGEWDAIEGRWLSFQHAQVTNLWSVALHTELSRLYPSAEIIMYKVTSFSVVSSSLLIMYHSMGFHNNRKTYTKCDWMMWIAAMGNEEQVLCWTFIMNSQSYTICMPKHHLCQQ